MEEIHPRWHEATKELIEQLEERGADINKLKALELFGRKADWHTVLFYKKIKSLEVWEINQNYEEDLKKNLPNAIIKIQDSIETLKESNNLPKFDLILIDNPMNMFGYIDKKNNEKKYCEHFDVIEHIGKIIDNNAILIFNVNRMPFNYTDNNEWRLKREKFYNIKNTNEISINFLFDFYKKKFETQGFQTEFVFNIPRVFYKNNDMTHYFVFKIKKMVN